MMTNAREDHRLSEKASKIKENHFFIFFLFFFELVIFLKNVRTFVRDYALNKIYTHTISYFPSQE